LLPRSERLRIPANIPQWWDFQLFVDIVSVRGAV
jgi:hypothetical protein